MFENLFDKNKSKNSNSDKNNKEEVHPLKPELTGPITTESIRAVFSKNSDIVFRELFIGGNENLPVLLVFFDGMSDTDVISKSVVLPLMSDEKLSMARTEKEVIDMIEHGYVYYPAQKTRTNMQDASSDIVQGGCALVFDKENVALTFDTKGFEHRTISEPTEENIIKGPKDVFVESIRVNTATVRRRIKSHKLIIEQTIVGRQSQTPVAFIYMDGITDKGLIKEVKAKVDKIDVDRAIETWFIEENVVDPTICTFPLIKTTERPDIFVNNILDGRVGILIDGIPVSFVVPVVLSQFLKSPDEYSQNFIVASLLRILRYSLMFISVYLPAFYVSVTTFHHEMIPTELALSIAASKEGVPYPAFVEIFFMLIAFEALIESGRRMPKNIGQAVSIVGALVVGEAAVSAKFISPAVVVIIAITAISGFGMPNQDFSNALRIWRFIMVILASFLGLVGMSLGAIYMLFVLASIETFGIPYLSPLAANEGKDLEDVIIRFPLRFIKYRPSMLKPINKRRQK